MEKIQIPIVDLHNLSKKLLDVMDMNMVNCVAHIICECCVVLRQGGRALDPLPESLFDAYTNLALISIYILSTTNNSQAI